MIQRIQTLFLLGVIIILILTGLKFTFFEYFTTEGIYRFSSFGITEYSKDGKELIQEIPYPIYAVLFGLALFTGIIIFGYKNLRKQARQAQLLWGFYVMLLLGIVAWKMFIAPSQIKGTILNSYFSHSFYLLVIGLPMVQMAVRYIRKDKEKVESIDRVR